MHIYVLANSNQARPRCWTKFLSRTLLFVRVLPCSPGSDELPARMVVLWSMIECGQFLAACPKIIPFGTRERPSPFREAR